MERGDWLMTLLRRLALRISNAVVEYVSPGCKEWAEGLAREADFVKDDWAALAWEIGSTRVLLDRRVAPAGNCGNVPSRPPLWRVWLISIVVQILTSCIFAFRGTDWQDRIGWGLVAFGWVYWAACQVIDWLSERNAPPISDIESYRLFSRAKLERRLKRYTSVRRWFPVLATVSMCTGLALTLEDGSLWGRVLVGFVVAGGTFAIWLQCLDSPAKIQVRLERVNMRVAERGR
jgi:hypothetical protein